MCWPHVHRNLESHFKHLRSLNKEITNELKKDIEDLQWAADSKESFLNVAKLLEKKYLEKDSDQNTNISIKNFFQYLKSTWIQSTESNWFEGANAFGVSNNQGIEGVNQSIKDGHTCRKKLPLGTFCSTMLRMTNEWSLQMQDLSVITTGRAAALNGQFGLKYRTEGYSWYLTHKQNENFIGIKPQGKKTLLSDVEAIWAIPSSNSKNESASLKDLAKSRMALRTDSTSSKSFNEFIQTRSSCWLVERREGLFFCDCYNGIKGRICKHAVGLMYKTGDLEVTDDVRSKPLGQKRRRGRPKKLPHCLTNSPSAPVIPMASYHQPSPDLQLQTLSPLSHTAPSSPVLPALAQRRPDPTTTSPLQTLARQASAADTPSACPPPPLSCLPPATRKSRKRKVDEGALSPPQKRVLRQGKILKN